MAGRKQPQDIFGLRLPILYCVTMDWLPSAEGADGLWPLFPSARLVLRISSSNGCLLSWGHVLENGKEAGPRCRQRDCCVHVAVERAPKAPPVIHAALVRAMT